MSKAYHKNGLYVDTGLLRDHISKLQEEKNLAYRLYEEIAVMKIAADPTAVYRYDSVLRDIAQMIEYFNTMANLLTRVDDEAVQLSKELRGVIKDSTELNQHIVAEKFVL